MLRLAVTTAAGVAVLAGGNVGATLTPNVRGTVPTAASGRTTSTGCFVGEPCDPPIGTVSTYVTFSRSGHATVRVRAIEGSFAVHLAPATYRIALTPAAGTVSPASVRVPRIGVVRLHLVVQPNP